MLLGIEGWTAPAVALTVGLTRRICQRWAGDLLNLRVVADAATVHA